MSRAPEWLDPRTLRWLADGEAAEAARALKEAQELDERAATPRPAGLLDLKAIADADRKIAAIATRRARWLRGIATRIERRRPATWSPPSNTIRVGDVVTIDGRRWKCTGTGPKPRARGGR